jgi:hypothetical protein
VTIALSAKANGTQPSTVEKAKWKIRSGRFARMSNGSNANLEQLQRLMNEIRGKSTVIENLTPPLRNIVVKMEGSFPVASQRPGEYWKTVFLVNSLVRIRLFLEQNLNYLEPVSLLGITRYLFELTVWLRLLQLDAQYGFACYYNLLKQQRDFYAASKKQAEREISYLRDFEKVEETLLKEAILAAMNIPQEAEGTTAIRQAPALIAVGIDEDASRKFSLHAEQARRNGYGFQAHLVETKVVPRHAKAVKDIELELHAFESWLTEDVRAFAKQRWRWKDQAEKAGMGEEYEFIYTYTSRLMHANPASIITDQKNLELEEIRMFLKYALVRIIDVIRMADEFIVAGSSRA